ncbi:MAG: putative molybdenum cofactor guanylyltransferase [Promethearchaeota archaeon]|nr:MAG: putative molybdenum cofactor guanylyltransferase [Candidatus Lokiarchaeota archaeon]
MIKISTENNYLAFVILVGGKSRRFGEDKGLFEFRRKPLIDYQIETLTKFPYNIFIIAHTSQQVQEYIERVNYEDITGFILDELGDTVVSDVRSPMIGLYSAFLELEKLSYQKIFAISCDMPLIQPPVVDLLINESYNHDAVIPIWNNWYVEPLFAIYPISKGLKVSREYILKKKFKLTNLIKKEWDVNYISIENKIKAIDKKLLTFLNINRVEDLNILKYKYRIEKKKNK